MSHGGTTAGLMGRKQLESSLATMDHEHVELVRQLVMNKIEKEEIENELVRYKMLSVISQLLSWDQALIYYQVCGTSTSAGGRVISYQPIIPSITILAGYAGPYDIASLQIFTYIQHLGTYHILSVNHPHRPRLEPLVSSRVQNCLPV